jgi:hypothetical protein
VCSYKQIDEEIWGPRACPALGTHDVLGQRLLKGSVSSLDRSFSAASFVLLLVLRRARGQRAFVARKCLIMEVLASTWYRRSTIGMEEEK